MLNFDTTKEEMLMIFKIVERVKSHKQFRVDTFKLSMDLEAVHSNGCYLDFAALLNFDTFGFFHDIFGIMENIDRETGKLLNCFIPRCAK